MLDWIRKLLVKSRPAGGAYIVDVGAKSGRGDRHGQACIAHRMTVTLTAEVRGEIYRVRFFPDQADEVADRLGRMAADERLNMPPAAARLLASRCRGAARLHPRNQRLSLIILSPHVTGYVTRE